MKIIQYLINGISIGSVYAIIALGYTMVYGIAKMLNFAHGDVIMVGAYISFCVTNYLGLPVVVSILAAMAVCTLLGVLIEGLAYKPLRGTPSLAVLITAIGVSYFLQNAAQLIWSSSPKNFTSIVTFQPLRLAGGQLVVTGEGLHIGKLTLDGGELHVDGHIDSISYEEPAAGRTSLLSRLFGCNMKDGSIGKISENRFARADLEHTLLCVDDDMRMEALRQTNYVKSIVTAQGKMDLERKGKQSYQGWMFARLLAFSNGDLQALYDRSDGFYRRQLVLTTKEKPAGRVDDPDLAEKMKAEVEGIFLWAFEGLQRLVANNFKFTESQRTRDNREAVRRDNNNVFDFLESEGYIRLKADCTISSKELYEIYRMWCEENNLTPLKRRSFSESVIANQNKYNLEYCNKITNAAGRRVWGFFGIEAVASPNINGFSDVSERTYVPEEWR